MNGAVKNRRKDGAYYWVHAIVLRKIASDGSVRYLSIRTKATSTDVEACEILYAQLRSEE